MLLITDRQQESYRLSRDLELVHRCTIVPLPDPLPAAVPCRLVISDVALDNTASIGHLRAALSRHRPPDVPFLCLLRQSSHHALTQANDIGASTILPADTPRDALLGKVVELIGAQGDDSAANDNGHRPARSAMLKSGIALGNLLDAAGEGRPVSPQQLLSGSDSVLAAIEEADLRPWLDVVRAHDDATYQHCLLVAGLAASFAVKLGLRREDRRLLTQAALLHDIGKARIPLVILNKTGKLTEAEMNLLRTHAADGHELLVRQGGFPEEMLRVVRHHHEYLDGSGYPDGLRAAQIPDLVRLTTICDIYAALIERRPYKEAMPTEEAYDILMKMRGKLDGDLVGAFRPVAEAPR